MSILRHIKSRWGERLRKNPINELMKRNRDGIHIHSKPLYQSLGDNSFFFFFLKDKGNPL